MPNLASVIIPCYNDARTLEASLRAVLAQRGDGDNLRIEVIVALNGCTDDSRSICERMSSDFQQRGWRLAIIDLPIAFKAAALNAGDAEARGQFRIYMDADVVPEPTLVGELVEVLKRSAPTYATGTLRQTTPSPIVRLYGKAWRASPPIDGEVNGIGLYAVNAPGRARWRTFPAIHNDDTFVRLQFDPAERVRVCAAYSWPLPASWRDLVRCRLRWTEGNFEVKRLYPELRRRWRRLDGHAAAYASLFLRMPLSSAVFAGTYLICRMLARRDVVTRDAPWRRGQRAKTRDA